MAEKSLWGEIMDKDEKITLMPENKLYDLVVNSLEGLVVTDTEGRFVFASHKWEELTGLKLADVKGIPTYKVTPETRVGKCIETKQPLFGEVVHVPSKEGGEVPMVSYYTPLFDGEEFVGCATVCASQGMSEVLDVSSKVESMMSELHYFRKQLAKEQGAKYTIDNIAGSSIKMQEMKAAIRRCARTASTVIIQGETGTGKELVAHSIHTLSSRSAQPFVKINCAAIPAELLESELFGYVGGAFTGANKAGKKGKFQLANGGTLFLDEINQMPFALQPKLLRAIQEREVEPVGAAKPEKVDVRIVAASNKDLLKMVKAGEFREDLYYRLNVIPIIVPPLRERREDIPEIAEATLRTLNDQLGMAVPGISEDAKQKLQGYDWPGNVRELRNVIERAMNEAWTEVLTWKHFRAYFVNKAYVAQPAVRSKKGVCTISEAKAKAEKEAILNALEAAAGNKAYASEMLGITRAMLYRKMDKYHIEY